MRPAIQMLCVLLLAGCGPAPDPPLETGKGELAPFLTKTVSQATGSYATTNRLVPIQGTWSSRVLTPRHVSTHYTLPRGWQAVQVSTDLTNMAPIREWLTASLGAPVNVGG